MDDFPQDETFEDDEDLTEDESAAAAESRPDVVTFTARLNKRDIRLDVLLANRFSRLSRSAVHRLIKTGAVLVNGRTVKASYTPAAGDEISVEMLPAPRLELTHEYMPLDIIYEDEKMIAVNKPSGIVVHPSRGHWGGTLINAVLYHCHNLSHIEPGRPGIVHRLDRETTGVILFMKDDWAHRHVARQFQERRTRKEYLTIVEGEMEYDSGDVSMPLGRHPTQPRKMAVRMETGREAQTAYKVLERFRGYTFVSAAPRTGRTHQIRVHLGALGHPVAADELYSNKGRVYLSELTGHQAHPSDEQPLMARQALHAHRLSIEYPGRHEPVEFVAELPEDMLGFLEVLRKRRPK